MDSQQIDLKPWDSGKVKNYFEEDQLSDDYTIENGGKPISKSGTTEGQQTKDGQETQESPLKMKRKFKRKNPIQINTSRSRGQLKLIKSICWKYGWKQVFGDQGDILWSGLAIPYDQIQTSLHIRTNRIPGMVDLCHKKKTGYFLNQFRQYFQDDFDFFPRTFILPQQSQEFESFFQNNQGVYIVKPSSGCQGDGIKIIEKLKDLNSYSSNSGSVVQQYIHPPLIIDNKKFDLRLYVLIASIDPLIVYLNDQGLCRFCTEDYKKPSTENIKNAYMHLTNYSLNKESEKFIKPDPDKILEPNDATKRTLTSIWKSLQQVKGIDVDQIKADIEQLVVKVVASMYPFLRYNYKAAFGQQKARCFHVIGFDVLLDSKGRPWLLELNNNPSFNIDHDVYNLKTGKTQTQVSPLDSYVQQQVLVDSMMIMMKSPQQQIDTVGVGQNFNTFQMLIGGQLQDLSHTLFFSMIVDIYAQISGHQFQETITSSQFVKLAQFQGMTNDQFMKNDYEILFTQILFGQETKFMDFIDFIRALQLVSCRLRGSFKLMDLDTAFFHQMIEQLHAQIAQ